MMIVLTKTSRRFVPAALVVAGVCVLAPLAGSAVQGQTTPYVMYTADGRRTVVVRTSVTPETIALEQLTTTFGLTFTEDRAANGLVIGTKGDPIFAFPGQSFVRTSGRVIALDGPVQRDRNAWTVPTDFLTKALGPAVGQPIVIRRSSRLILVGAVRVPEIAARIERTATGARVVITIQPATAHRVTRDGSHLTVHFDATALDTAPFTGFIPDFAPAARVDGSNLVLDLGPQVATHRADDDRISGALTIELLPAPPPAPAKPPQAPPPAAPPQLDLSSTGLRTIVIDAGHGGDDVGAVGAGGAKEKDLTLAIARRLKAAIESRLGLRVLLTRDGDDTIPPDRRTELANNNKADVLLSLHVNWSVRPDARGAQVYTPAAIAARPTAAGADARKLAVPVVGGGSRVIDPVPWETAQLPFVAQSTAFGAVLARQFADHAVPLFAHQAVQAPMRILTAAHMPAVLIELAFLSNADDERSLGSGDWQSAMVESVIAALTEVRRGIPGGAAGGERH
jgi:N-acetylmuramoyl-L-alanine amidase